MYGKEKLFSKLSLLMMNQKLPRTKNEKILQCFLKEKDPDMEKD